MPEAVTSLGLSSHLDLFTSRCVCPPRAVTLLLPQGPEECCQPTGMLSAGKGPRLHEAIPSFAKAPPPKSTPSEGTCSKEREVAKHLLRAQATPPPHRHGPCALPCSPAPELPATANTGISGAGLHRRRRPGRWLWDPRGPVPLCTPVTCSWAGAPSASLTPLRTSLKLHAP